MVRAIGIDPGTTSFSVFGIDDGNIILDEDIPSNKIAEDPEYLINIIMKAEPDIIGGPSGYGLPIKWCGELEDWEIRMMILKRPDDKDEIPVLSGLKRFIEISRDLKLPMITIPSVILLPTVPKYRKYNRIDMGTADKLAVTVLAVKEEAEFTGLDYSEINLILVEIGSAYTSVIGVEGGKIVDGIGGSQGPLGFMSHGRMDGEVAYLLGSFSKKRLFEGGVIDISGRRDMTPEDFERLVDKDAKVAEAWSALIEEIEKFVAAMCVSVPRPRSIILSGRLSSLNKLSEVLYEKLSKYGRVRKLRGLSMKAKAPAQGSAIIANGYIGGEYKKLIEHMRILEASGTVLDYVLLNNWGRVMNVFR